MIRTVRPSLGTVAGGLFVVAMWLVGVATAAPGGSAATSPAGVGQESSANPHGDIGIPCTDCHSTASWTELRDPLVFDHAKTAQFSLVDGHGAADCAACHETLIFQHVASACADCHGDPHRGELGFGCETCHTSAGWQDRQQMFIYHFTTLFPLQGAHATVDCDSCHTEPPPFEFASTPTDCAACHVADYQATTNPDHQQSGFPLDCAACHSDTNWQTDVVFDHTAFTLTGAHARTDCESCHLGGEFAGTPTECHACHAADYEGTVDPNHVQAGLPTDCESCHTTSDWGGAVLDHDAFFPLLGAHRPLECETCHVDGVFAGTPTDCYSCHKAAYDDTTDPDHAQAGFPTDCEACHTERKWTGATFDHDGFFQLSGAHRQVDCADCHVDGVYSGTPTDCYSCHKAAYDDTTDPDHAQAGFPTDCDACHTEQRWEGAVFDHDGLYFPIYSGEHRGEWNSCTDCHVNPNDFVLFECTTCHEHNESEMAEEHDEVSGYQWVSSECLQCHPSGDERFGIGNLIGSLQRRFPELRPRDAWRLAPQERR